MDHRNSDGLSDGNETVIRTEHAGFPPPPQPRSHKPTRQDHVFRVLRWTGRPGSRGETPEDCFPNHSGPFPSVLPCRFTHDLFPRRRHHSMRPWMREPGSLNHGSLGKRGAGWSFPRLTARASRAQVHPRVCVYYCRTYYKAVRVEGGGKWRTCAMRYDEPRLVWTSLPVGKYNALSGNTASVGFRWRPPRRSNNQSRH